MQVKTCKRRDWIAVEKYKEKYINTALEGDMQGRERQRSQVKQTRQENMIQAGREDQTREAVKKKPKQKTQNLNTIT